LKNNNIVLFSSGASEKSGLLKMLQELLAQRGYNCSIWRNLFEHANDSNNIALLPMLIKKIPTFDYAILICEGHDLTTLSRGAESFQVKTMRDNVLFEIGLCAMALGLNRTILLTGTDVRLPDDLMGKNNTVALKQILLSDIATQNVEEIAQQVDEYIKTTGDTLHQIIIGAASSIACGYIANFVCRILEHIEDDIELSGNERNEIIRVSSENVFLEILLPENIDPTAIVNIKKSNEHLLKGCISTARNRPVYFSCCYENEKLHIIDSPTSIVTSYDTAKIILNMDADDSLDVHAAQRFTSKELNLFESTLNSLLNQEFITQVIDEHYPFLSTSEKEKMIHMILDIVANRTVIRRIDAFS